MHLRSLTAVAVLAATALALPGHAAPAKPQIVDAQGDAVVPESSLDIVSGLFASDGKALKVTITYAGDPTSLELATYGVTFSAPGCGEVLLQSFGATTGTYGTTDCSEDAIDGFTVKAEGSSLVFRLPFSLVGKSLKKGAKLTALRAWTGIAEPVAGFGPYDGDPSLVADEGTAAGYTVG